LRENSCKNSTNENPASKNPVEEIYLFHSGNLSYMAIKSEIILASPVIIVHKSIKFIIIIPQIFLVPKLLLRVIALNFPPRSQVQLGKR
jgi:hypothetical protein